MQKFQLWNGCYGNRGRYGVHLNDTVRLPDLKNKGSVNTLWNYLLRRPSYAALKSA